LALTLSLRQLANKLVWLGHNCLPFLKPGVGLLWIGFNNLKLLVALEKHKLAAHMGLVVKIRWVCAVNQGN